MPINQNQVNVIKNKLEKDKNKLLRDLEKIDRKLAKIKERTKLVVANASHLRIKAALDNIDDEIQAEDD